MEEVIGSIPIRSTNYTNNLAEPPSSSLAAFWQQISKCLRPSFAILLRSSLPGRSRSPENSKQIRQFTICVVSALLAVPTNSWWIESIVARTLSGSSCI